MQGFIINVNRVKDEDLIVTIISQNDIQTLYRFYGARHGTINLGFKIDYEIEESSKGGICRLKDVIHIGYMWINSREHLKLWQEFLPLFHTHLRSAEDIGSFYFDLLENASNEWHKQNPKRVAVESYVKLLKQEGRLHVESQCFLCSLNIDEDISLIRAFLPTHSRCSHTMTISKNALNELYKNETTLFLNDKEIHRVWSLLLEGL